MVKTVEIWISEKAEVFSGFERESEDGLQNSYREYNPVTPSSFSRLMKMRLTGKLVFDDEIVVFGDSYCIRFYNPKF